MEIQEFIEIANLLDIYSNLLTGKQKEYLIDHFENDLSVSEIAKNNNISRQAVHDNIKRGISILYLYEEKLGFYKKNKDLIKKLSDLKENSKDKDFVAKIDEIIDDIL